MGLGVSLDDTRLTPQHPSMKARVHYQRQCGGERTGHPAGDDSLPGPAPTRRRDSGPCLRRGYRELPNAAHAAAPGASL